MKSAGLLVLTSIFLGACTINEDVRPNDMSATAHDRVASVNEASALREELSYNPNADVDRQHCAPVARDPSLGVAIEPCSTRTTNSTQFHLVEARHYREAAAAHRRAAATLREAEATACDGISNQDKATSPFARRNDILTTVIRTEGSKVVGASILVRATPGMSSDYLGRWVACQLNRNAALGFDRKEALFDPLNVKGANAKVESYGNDFRVTITSDDQAAANDIATRANNLIAAPETSR